MSGTDGTSRPVAVAADADELAQATAPEEFKRAILHDPYSGRFKFDYEAARGGPINVDALPQGGDTVSRAGYYFDLDGEVADWYRQGDRFPSMAPGSKSRGHFLYLTNRRDATTSDLRWILLRRGWGGNVKDAHIR